MFTEFASMVTFHHHSDEAETNSILAAVLVRTFVHVHDNLYFKFSDHSINLGPDNLLNDTYLIKQRKWLAMDMSS